MVPEGPHPKLGVTGGRKPAANASATGASALRPPAGANKFTCAERRTVVQTLRSQKEIASPDDAKFSERASDFFPSVHVHRDGLRRPV